MNLLGTLGGLYRFHRKHEGNKKHVSDWGRHFGPGYIFITLSLSCKTKKSTLHCISVHQCLALYGANVFTVSVSFVFHFRHMLMGAKFSPCVHMFDEFWPTSKVFRSCRVRDGAPGTSSHVPPVSPIRAPEHLLSHHRLGTSTSWRPWHATKNIWIYSMKFPSYPIKYRHHHIETQSS